MIDAYALSDLFFTCTADFRRWPVKPPEPHKPDVYCPPADPFDGNSSYQMAYVFHKEPPRKSMKPPDAAMQSVHPLDERTDYRDNYTRHLLPPKVVREIQPWLPNPNPLDDLSNYRKDYTRKDQGMSRLRVGLLRGTDSNNGLRQEFFPSPSCFSNYLYSVSISLSLCHSDSASLPSASLSLCLLTVYMYLSASLFLSLGFC